MIWTARISAAVAMAVGLMTMAQAVECTTSKHAKSDFTVCKVDAGKEQIRLFLNDPKTNIPLGSFDAVNAQLKKNGETLAMAMNAGMYHRDRSPVGLYIQDHKEYAPLVSRKGPGNFGMLPNGLFCLRDGRADVIESIDYKKKKSNCRDASQSGPMLVINGALHPRFLADSDSRYIRNGVGTSKDGRTVYFAISERPVTFYDFGTLFRDVLKTPNALYFDGNISRLYVGASGRHDLGFPMGPMVGVIATVGE